VLTLDCLPVPDHKEVQCVASSGGLISSRLWPPAAAIANQELELPDAVGQVHEQVAGLLGPPVGIG
jgi:hypothetical protein